MLYTSLLHPSETALFFWTTVEQITATCSISSERKSPKVFSFGRKLYYFFIKDKAGKMLFVFRTAQVFVVWHMVKMSSQGLQRHNCSKKPSLPPELQIFLSSLESREALIWLQAWLAHFVLPWCRKECKLEVEGRSGEGGEAELENNYRDNRRRNWDGFTFYAGGYCPIS